ncbi:MAG: hypothetical protein PHY48_15240 [Candidatus Cloacimonetes bacterium]|nr:hypothetical protein [Candidatus Cloacimonadota bacterium]
MVRNISARHINSSSATDVSMGEYNTDTKVIRLWCYYNRFRRVGDDLFIDIQDCDLSAMLSNVSRIELVDLDWDKVYTMSVKEYLANIVKKGFRVFKVSDLSVKG